MINAKTKAGELVLKFMRLQEPNYNWFNTRLAVKCALITVDEMLNNPKNNMMDLSEELHDEFWNAVRTEINLIK